MSNELAMLDLTTLPANQYDEVKIELSSYLARLQLGSGQSKAVQDGVVKPGHYFITKDDQHTPLDNTVDILPLRWRPTAMRFGADSVQSYHDINSSDFKNIQAQSTIPNSGCIWGFEFLVYVPSKDQFVTFMLGNVSARKKFEILKSLIGKACTLSVGKAKNSKGQWFIPEPAPAVTQFSVPAADVIMEQIKKFDNPPAPAETAAPADAGQAGRVR